MVKVRIVTESDTGEEAIFEGESEEAYAEIKQQEKDQFTSPRYQVSEVEIEGYEPFEDDDYDEFLDDNYPEYVLGNLTFSPSRIMKELDPTAYRISQEEYNQSRLEDVQYEVEQTTDYDDDNEQGFWDSVFQVLW